MKRLLLACVVSLAMSSFASTSYAGEEFSDDRLATILARVLAFDRNLSARARPTLTIALVSARGQTASVDGLRRAFLSLKELKVQGMTIEVVTIEYTDRSSLERALREYGADVLFIGKELSPALRDITSLCRTRKIASLASDPMYLDEGVSVGVFPESGKPKIHVNLNASREEGMAFQPELLKLAKIVGS